MRIEKVGERVECKWGRLPREVTWCEGLVEFGEAIADTCDEGVSKVVARRASICCSNLIGCTLIIFIF